MTVCLALALKVSLSQKNMKRNYLMHGRKMKMKERKGLKRYATIPAFTSDQFAMMSYLSVDISLCQDQWVVIVCCSLWFRSCSVALS